VGAVPGEYVEDPEQVTLSRDPATGEWQGEDITRGRPGFYATEEVRGNGGGPVRVDVKFGNGQGHQLRFASEEDVEFPGEGDRLGGTTPRPRNALTVVVDRKGRGPIVSAQAHEDAGVSGQQ